MVSVQYRCGRGVRYTTEGGDQVHMNDVTQGTEANFSSELERPIIYATSPTAEKTANRQTSHVINLVSPFEPLALRTVVCYTSPTIPRTFPLPIVYRRPVQLFLQDDFLYIAF